MLSRIQVWAGDESEASSPVVVELFTSEGCSSCPPADKLLETLRSDEALVLSFHVDYWNQLGWRDPFSSPQFTLRQRQYAGLLRLDQVYTPQMIVGGETEFVGSNSSLASAAIFKAKRKRASESLSLVVKRTTASIQADYKLNNVPKNARLNLAVVQKSAKSNATAGENAGKKLSHVNVVRTFKTIEIDSNATGSVDFEVPDGIENDELLVAGYLQDFVTGRIGAATTQPVR